MLFKAYRSEGVLDLKYSFAAKVATLLLSIGNQSVLAWFLGPEDRGAFAVCVVYSSTLAILGGFGLAQAIQVFLASGRIGTKSGFRFAAVSSLLGGVCASSVGYLLVLSGISYFDKASFSSFMISLGLVPITILSTNFIGCLVALKQFRLLLTMSLVQGVFQIFASYLVLGPLGWAVEGALIVSGTSGLFLVVTIWGTQRSSGSENTQRIDRSSLGDLLIFGMKSYIASVTTLANVQIGVLLFSFMATKQEIGIFAVGTDLMLKVVMVPDIVNQVIQPRIAADPAGRPDLTSKAIRWVGLFCTSVVIVLLAFAEPLIATVFSPAFLPATTLMYIVAPGVVLRCYTKPITMYLLGTNRPGMFSMATVMTVFSNALLLILLVPSQGLAGGAFALSAAYAVSAVFLLALFRSYTAIPLAKVFIWTRQDTKALSAMLTWSTSNKQVG